ncbi:MAG: hypothetical protein KAS23_16175, partial [Anaerohalosphaera sp.]|nr:hypothetical protein [Anaerohalosphaera sp.]
YATGLSAEKQWRDLRAGGSFMLATAILALSLAIGLGLAFVNWKRGIFILGWGVTITVIFLGIEIILNSIMDVYRPRVPGQYARLSLDSRLLGVINEPGGILHTFASTIDYQFGFKVSQTWFYRLLEKAIIPLFLFSVISIYSLSCIVIVEPGEQAVIEHFGKYVETVDPGLTIKLPYPFDMAYKYPTSRISQVDIGFVESEHEEDMSKPLLWGEKHYSEEYDLLVASTSNSVERTSETREKQETVPVNIIRAAVPVQYRIKVLKDYVYKNSDPEALLTAICYQQLAHFAAASTIDIDSAGSDTNSLLGAGRQRASQILTESIQNAIDKAELGVEIV